MIIIGVDYHPSFHTIAFLMEETGEYAERELNHSDGEAEKFHRELKQRGISVRVGMEATGLKLLVENRFPRIWVPSSRVGNARTALCGVSTASLAFSSDFPCPV